MRLRLVPTRLLLGIALVATLSACGDGDGTITRVSGDGPGASSSGAAATPAGRATVASIRRAGQDTRAVGSGRFEIIFGGDGFDVATTGEFSGDRTRLVQRFGDDEAGAGELESVTEGSIVYLRGPLTDVFGNEGDRWLRFDSSGLLDGVDPSALLSGGPSSLGVESLGVLDGEFGEVSELGTEEVRGVATEHYRIEVDLSGVDQPAVPTADDTLPVELWVGEDGLVRRIRLLAADLAPEVADGAPADAGVTVEFFDLGADITIDVPTEYTDLSLDAFLGGN